MAMLKHTELVDVTRSPAPPAPRDRDARKRWAQRSNDDVLEPPSAGATLLPPRRRGGRGDLRGGASAAAMPGERRWGAWEALRAEHGRLRRATRPGSLRSRLPRPQASDDSTRGTRSRNHMR